MRQVERQTHQISGHNSGGQRTVQPICLCDGVDPAGACLAAEADTYMPSFAGDSSLSERWDDIQVKSSQTETVKDKEKEKQHGSKRPCRC